MEKVNILLVDDQPAKLLSYQAVLEELDQNLVLARSGREALQALLKQEFALVLLDVVMPEMDGFETATLIRERPRLKDTPIIFLTAFGASDMDRLKGYQMGAVDFIFAPVVPEIMRAKVSVFVELYRHRLELAQKNEQLQAEIAERKRAQEQALHAERLAAIGEMVAGLAHESRNALQQIQASVEMLGRRVSRDSESYLVNEIQKAHDRLHQLLEEVRGYVTPLELSCEMHDLGRLWKEAWDRLAPMRQRRDVALLVDTGDVDLRCCVDPSPAERLFRNVLESALAACGKAGRIAIRCREDQLNEHPAVCVRIEDSGVSLTEEQKKRIFEPFFTTKTRGSGLGMAIAKRIVEAHGGRIAVANGVDCGTAIEVLLPRGRS
jgi:signal transduction histidine kinase